MTYAAKTVSMAPNPWPGCSSQLKVNAKPTWWRTAAG